MASKQKIPTDSLTFRIVESACEHLTSLCDEATKLTAQMKPKENTLEFIPGLVVALVSGGMEVSTAVVCVFKKGHPHELKHLWTEPTMQERLQRMKSAYTDFVACNRNQEQFSQLLKAHSSKDPWLNIHPNQVQDAMSIKTRRSSPSASPTSSNARRATSAGSSTAIRELRNENSKLFAELQLLRETHHQPTLKQTDADPAAEILSLRRRLHAVERRSSADRARIEAKAAEIAVKEAQLATREIAVAKNEWMRSLEMKRLHHRIPPPTSARTETAPPLRRWR